MYNTNTSHVLSDFLGFMRDSKEKYEMQYDTVRTKDKETCDYLHKLELVPLKYHDEAKLAKALKEVREQRRQAKDDTIVLKPIVDWMAENEPAIRSMEKLLGNVRNEERKLQNRHYIPRVLKEDSYNETA